MRIDSMWPTSALVRILVLVCLGVGGATAASAQPLKPTASQYNQGGPPHAYEQIQIRLNWDSGKMRRWNTGGATIVGHRLDVHASWWDRRGVKQTYQLSPEELTGLKAFIETPQGIKTLWTGGFSCGGYRLAIVPRTFNMAKTSYLTYRISDPNWGDTKPLERYLMALIARKLGRPIYGRGLGR